MNNLSIEQIELGIKKVLDNSMSLIEEAKTLHDAGFFTRAFTLAHLAREELSKINMLHAAEIYLLLEKPIDWKRLKKRFNSHISKLYNDALGTFINTEISQDVDRKAFLKNMLSNVRGSNNWKNKSLYVDFDGKNFTSPTDIIKEHMSLRTIELALMSLSDYEYEFKAFSVIRTKGNDWLREQFKSISDYITFDNEWNTELLLCINELTVELRRNLKREE